MSEQRMQLEHLSVELFHLIFEYLAPHELLQAFNNLNNRFTAILAQLPLCLPNNQHMTYELYLNYISKINVYASQIVYLHLSERYAPHAVDELLSEVSHESIMLPALKAVTIKDLPPHTFITLFDKPSILTKVQSITVDLSDDCYHYSDYAHSIDIDYILPLLNNLPNLCSLYLLISPCFDSGYIDELKNIVPLINTQPNLHTISIKKCSRPLFVELLDHGRLPKLRRLNVEFSRAQFFDFKTERVSSVPSSPAVPFKQNCIPELRFVSVYLYDDVAGMLTYLDNIHRHGQLENLEINGYVDISNNGNMPRLTDLRQWLKMSMSKDFTFQMNLSLTSTDDQHLKTLLTEYRRATGRVGTKYYGKVKILYPTMSLIQQVESNDDESDDDSSDESMSNGGDYMINIHISELDIGKPDCEEEEWVEEMKAISCWPCLQKITLHGDCMGDKNMVNVAISLLLHIAQRSPRFRALSIDATDPFDSVYENDDLAEIHFGHLLSSNVELGMILTSQLEVLTFNGEYANCSFLDLARIFDRLFSHSTLSPILKCLTFDVGAHPRSWLNTRHLMHETKLVFNRFPSLIHFSLNCKPYNAYKGTIYDFSNLAPKWYDKWLMWQSKQDIFRTLNYRHRPNSLDVWL